MPNAHSDQDERRRAIRELLDKGPIPTQQLLVTELARRGFTATQSSVSRDLREIGAVKTARGYELEHGNVAEMPELSAIGEFVRAILPAGPHLLVLRTAIGAAQRVALALD
ncbi:MAG: ArgR family transcriptional regulator, partial [Gammaproteobacteria bacterium]